MRSYRYLVPEGADFAVRAEEIRDDMILRYLKMGEVQFSVAPYASPSMDRIKHRLAREMGDLLFREGLISVEKSPYPGPSGEVIYVGKLNLFDMWQFNDDFRPEYNV